MKKLLFDHPRLWISVAAGCAVFFLLPAHWSTLSRVLVCWNCGVILFLALIFFWMTRLTAAQICTKYIEEDETAPIILVVVTIAAAFSLVAIVEPLATMQASDRHGARRALRAGGAHADQFLAPRAHHVHDALRRHVLQRE